MEDKSSLGNPGNGMECRASVRRRGADPPKNESGWTGISTPKNRRPVSSGNGCCIAAKTFSDPGPGVKPVKSKLHMRSLCSSAAMKLSTSNPSPSSSNTSIGKSGQASSVFLTGVLRVHQSRRSRRRGDPKTTFRHFRHTCTSACQASVRASST